MRNICWLWRQPFVAAVYRAGHAHAARAGNRGFRVSANCGRRTTAHAVDRASVNQGIDLLLA